jgi:hypothetical protein
MNRETIYSAINQVCLLPFAMKTSCPEKFLSMWDTHPLVAGSRAAGGGGAAFS